MNSTANSNFNGGYNENAEPGFCAVCATGVISNGSVTLTILWILAKKNSNGIDTNFVLNLLIADWLQSVGFSMSLYWMAISDITPGLYCDIQGVIMSIGGMGSDLLFGHFGIPAPYSLLVVCSCIFSLNGLTDSIIYGCLTYIASLKPVFEHHSKDHKKKYRYDDDNDLANMNNDIEENSGTKNQSEEDFCEVIGEIEEIANDG
ncbi:9493_t:CDS:2, partial [Ambispora leptoticha]